jgi:hypothetical protein
VAGREKGARDADGGSSRRPAAAQGRLAGAHGTCWSLAIRCRPHITSLAHLTPLESSAPPPSHLSLPRDQARTRARARTTHRGGREEPTHGTTWRTHGGSSAPYRRAAVEAGRGAVPALFVGGALSPGIRSCDG